MRKVEILPTRDCEAGYGPDYLFTSQLHKPGGTDMLRYTGMCRIFFLKEIAKHGRHFSCKNP